MLIVLLQRFSLENLSREQSGTKWWPDLIYHSLLLPDHNDGVPFVSSAKNATLLIDVTYPRLRIIFVLGTFGTKGNTHTNGVLVFFPLRVTFYVVFRSLVKADL